MTNKSPDAFRTISEVAEWLGVPTHVLRFWESRFSQIKPVKRAGGRRYYRPSDMELLGGIRKLLHEDGMTIRGVQKLLREEGVKHVSSLSPELSDTSMKDITPSNVVTLDTTKPDETIEAEPEPIIDSAPEDTPPVPELPETDKIASSEPQDTAPVEISAEVSEPEEAPTPDAPDKTTPEDILDSPEGLEFLAHDADISPPDTALPDTIPPEAPPEPEVDTGVSDTANIDISHIPDDPAEADDDIEGAPDPVLAALRQAGAAGALTPENRDGLTELSQRLTALKDRMTHERRPADQV